MGNTLTSAVSRIFQGPKTHILFIGLDNAGKTTACFRLNPAPSPRHALCHSSSYATVEVGSVTISEIDLGGHYNSYFFQAVLEPLLAQAQCVAFFC
mmetsp:Transcript_16800/g.39885  ORF Transcript_16800/g.39885 Transcript_16800/m.39885 type:complete len:96 (+) Transcript_16800:40-327(+)